MGIPNDSDFDLGNFSGQARLFPVPNLVMFPHVLQPLHIFESRYRAMTKDALDGDRLIAMAVLAPGWETEYENQPLLYPVACLAQIVNSQQLEDGRYHLLLQGLGRVNIREEFSQPRPFRVAKAEFLIECGNPEGAGQRRVLKSKILDAVGETVSHAMQQHAQIEKTLGEAPALGVLVDILAYSLALPLKLKAEMLGELNVDRRAARLLGHLKDRRISATGADPRFPPAFIPN